MKLIKVDIVNLISGGKLTLGSNALSEIHVATSGLKSASIVAFGKHMHWDISSTAKAIGATTRTLELHIASLYGSVDVKRGEEYRITSDEEKAA
jgi:hypothetical protein